MTILTSQLLTIANAYAAHRKMSLGTLGGRIAHHGNFFAKLADGHDCTTGKYETAMRWFEDHWPDDLEWPDGCLRGFGTRSVRGRYTTKALLATL